jgi:hypothetical protein
VDGELIFPPIVLPVEGSIGILANFFRIGWREASYCYWKGYEGLELLKREMEMKKRMKEGRKVYDPAIDIDEEFSCRS